MIVEAYETGFKAGIKPIENLKIWEWADKYRRLSSKAGAKEPGQYRTSRMPYLREIMEVLSPQDPTQQVKVIKGTQLGFTEVGINWFGHSVHIDPAPMMMFLPTIDVAKRHSKMKVAPVIEETPVLNERIQKPREKDSGNTTLMKEFPGGALIIAGANSAAPLRNISIKKLMLDEIDAYEEDLDEEGDTCSIAEKRTDGFGDERKIYKLSTPTLKGSKIDKEFNNSDQRHFYLPCPLCGQAQVLKWESLRFSHENWQLDSEVLYECEHCHGHFPEYRKTWMMENGEWRPHNPGHRHRGYKLSSLYSPIGFLSWREIVEEWLSAKADNDIAALKTWTNTRLAEPWDDSLASDIDSDSLLNRREQYGPVVPWQALLLIASVDTQDDRLECMVKAWGPKEESWMMEHRVFWGNPAEPELWNDLDEYLKAPWLHASGAVMHIACTTIDSGGHHAQSVYDFVKPRQRRRVYAVKGSQLTARPIVGKPSTNNKGKVLLYAVGTDTAKDLIFGRLGLVALPRMEEEFYRPLTDQPLEVCPGRMHFCMECDEEYFAQLTGETTEPPPAKKKRSRGIRKKARMRYVQVRERVEILDLEVYNLAGLKILNPKWEALRDRIVEQAKKAKEEMEIMTDVAEELEQDPERSVAATRDLTVQKVSLKQKAPARPRRGGWVSRW